MPSPSDEEFQLDDDAQAAAALLRELSADDRALDDPPESIWNAIQAQIQSADAAMNAPAPASETREQARVEAERSLVRQGVATAANRSGSGGPPPASGRDDIAGAGSDDSAAATSRGGAQETDTDLEALVLAYEATRAMLRAKSATELSAALVDAVERFGGTVGPADVEGGDVLPIDISLGEGEPLLPRADQYSLARMRLEALLPTLVEDARLMLSLLE